MSGRQRYADFTADSLERMRYDDDRLLRKTIEYAPYAVLNYVNPIVSIIYGFTGFTMEKMTDEEYEKVMEERRREEEERMKDLEEA